MKKMMIRKGEGTEGKQMWRRGREGREGREGNAKDTKGKERKKKVSLGEKSCSESDRGPQGSNLHREASPQSGIPHGAHGGQVAARKYVLPDEI